MNPGRPILGYPSVTAAVLALEAKGMPHARIAEEVGLRPHKVREILVLAGRLVSTSGRIVLSDETLAALAAAAGPRGMDVRALAVALLDTIARDGLVAAVLDTEEPA